MEPLVEHFKEFYVYYLIGAACILPPLIFFRRFTVAAFMYLIELCIYLALMHGVMYGVIAVAAWFKDQSTMKRARGLIGETFDPGWTTPILRFWDKEGYEPQWLIYFEIGLAVLILYLMWKFRPPRMRRPRKWRADWSKTSKPGAKPGIGKKPGGYDYRKTR